jgi:hypothetical protein
MSVTLKVDDTGKYMVEALLSGYQKQSATLDISSVNGTKGFTLTK